LYKVRVDKASMQNHLHYDWWKYVIGIIATIFVWNMIITITRPQTPPEKRVDIFLVGGFAMDDALTALSERMLADFPQLLEINFTNIVLEGDPQLELAGRQKLMVMLGSQTGDVFVFNRDEFEVLARQGAFTPLDELMNEEIKDLIPADELENHMIAVEDGGGKAGELHVYGLPLKQAAVFDNTFFEVEDKIIAVMAYSRNMENAIEAVRWIVTQK